MLSSESMIMNYTTNEIVQISNPDGLNSSQTPTKAKVQKVQKKIRKESASSATNKSTPKQQQQHQQIQKNKQVISQLTSPSWSDKTVNLASSTCSTAPPSLTSKCSISSSGAPSSGSLNGQCLANTPYQLNQQQNQQQQQNLYQVNSKKKNQTKISPRSQASSLTSEISSFDLYSYNDCVGSSTSSTNQGVTNHPHLQNQANFAQPPYECINIHANAINFSPVVSPTQETLNCQQAPLHTQDHILHSPSPKSSAYYQQNSNPQTYTQSSSQKNNLNSSNANCYTNYNSGYASNQQNQFTSSEFDKFANNNSNPSSLLVNWSVLPVEIQRATLNMNGNIEEVQLNFDNCVPIIQMPNNKKLAYQKVREAQQLQEKLVFHLANLKEGTTLQNAIDNLREKLMKANGEIASSFRDNASASNKTGNECSESAEGQPQQKATKQKKASKKSSKQDQTIQNNCSPQKYPMSNNFSQNSQQIAQVSDSRQNDNTGQYNPTYSSNNAATNNNFYPYHTEEEMQNKEAQSNIQAAPFQPGNQQNRAANNEYSDNSAVHHHHAANNNQPLDGYHNHQATNKNGLMSPRKPAHSMQGYEEEVMSQQELMNNQINQYEDFGYQPKLRKYMSDPFGDYYYHNNHNYMSSMGNHTQIGNFNHSDNMDGALSVIYEDENPYYNQQGNMMSTNFKKDDDDTLYGYVSQNDTIEDLINSQSKPKQNKNGYYGGSCSNINNNFNSNGYYGSYADEANNGRVYNSRNTGVDSYFNQSNQQIGSSDNFFGSTKQRTSSVATTDLHAATSQRKLDFEYGFEASNPTFNKNY
ncbi:hypothetical protein ABPG74_002943 [Tetrahymena malaccensis]